MSNNPQSQFIKLQEQLLQEHPGSHDEATQLADSVVMCQHANADDIWKVLWDKPLYANAKVSVARRWADALEPDMKDAWRTWGTDPNLFLIRQIAPGIARTSFSVEGDLAQDIVGRSKVALHRLYRIQGGASALRKRADIAAKPFGDLIEGEQGLYDRIRGLQNEFGPGWGPITVLHFLTDLGLAVKPDLHLVRTMTTLGLSKGISPNKVPSLKEAVQLNYLVWKLILDIGHQSVTARNLRYTDKILMDISRLGLLSKDPALGPVDIQDSHFA
jgi:hypothetical protein